MSAVGSPGKSAVLESWATAGPTYYPVSSVLRGNEGKQTSLSKSHGYT